MRRRLGELRVASCLLATAGSALAQLCRLMSAHPRKTVLLDDERIPKIAARGFVRARRCQRRVDDHVTSRIVVPRPLRAWIARLGKSRPQLLDRVGDRLPARTDAAERKRAVGTK